MIGVVVIPTGLEAEIGGHAGDGNPVAKLIGACCDTVIVHPNVVNASDINEMPENCWYVEGSLLDEFLEGHTGLRQRSRPNKILVVANPPLTAQTINAVGAARATIGIDAEVMELKTPLILDARMENGIATGDVHGWEKLVAQVQQVKFDALAIHSPINVKREDALHYYRHGGVNPWGGVEAKASKLIANALNKPVAHAPKEREEVENDEELYGVFNEVVDPRIAPEAISICYLHCVLKGLHRAPTPCFGGTGVTEVDFMVSPLGCWGRPHEACIKAGVPIIMVRENKTVENKIIGEGGLVIHVDNYWEAAGLIMAWKAGVNPSSLRRPLPATKIDAWGWE